MSFNPARWWAGITEIVKKYGRFIDDSPPQAQIYGVIKDEDIFSIMPSEYTTPGGVTYHTRASVFDAQYNLTSVEEIRRFLAWDITEHEKEYSLEDFDCDDFAFVLTARLRIWSPGLAQGLLIVPGHAKNFFIDREKKVWEVEPQSDRISNLSDSIHQYIM